MAHPSNLREYLPSVTASLAKATAHAQALPDPSDLSFERSIHRPLAKGLDATSKKALGIAASLVNLAERAEGEVENEKGKGKGKLREQDIDDLTEDFERHFQGTLDKLLEQADTFLDSFTGKQKAAAIAVKDVPQKRSKPLPLDHDPTSARGRLPAHILAATNTNKPQLLFDPPIDNQAAGPSYRQYFSKKDHAMVPLDWSPSAEDRNSLLRLVGEERIDKWMANLSPYTYETIHLQHPNSLFVQADPIPYLPIANSPITYVDTPEQLSEMVLKLKQAKEIAVDLEHHQLRSYTGILCLMQISTREEDWVVDVIALRKELMEKKLGGVLVDPSIIKVFHGADMDITWLQQNFGMFVVGLFDTFHAAKSLDFPSLGLAKLLELYCDFTADKRYQTADWRIRPLPEEMLYYARSDTHYLLFIYDQLRNGLLTRNKGGQDLVREVLNKSAVTSLRIDVATPYDAEGGHGPGGWRGYLHKTFGAKGFSGPKYLTWQDSLAWGGGWMGARKERIFKRVHEWRDKVARLEDESTFYVLPPGHILNIASRPPTDELELRRLFNKGIPPVVAARKSELLKVVEDASSEAKSLWDAKSAVKAAEKAGAELEPKSPTPEPSASRDVSSNIISQEGMQINPIVAATEPVKKTDAVNISTVSIWDNLKAADKPAPAKSSLFGNTVLKVIAPPSKPPTSSLFGKTLSVATSGTSSPPTSSNTELAKEIVTGLLSLTTPSTETKSLETEPAPMEIEQEASARIIPEQVPYVKPKPKIGSVKAQINPDGAVIVGRQNPKKKRKQEVAQVNDDLQAPSDPTTASVSKKPKRAPVNPEDIPTIDYANEPNQLDTFKAEAPTKLKKPKKVHKPVIDTSGFKKPPMDPSMPAAGNKSMTVGSFK